MIDRVTEDALSLPTENRLIFVEKLLRSLNLPINEDIDRLWAEEAELRNSQIDSGKAKLVPGEEVFDRIKEKYKK